MILVLGIVKTECQSFGVVSLYFSSTITRMGMSTICTMMPGIAFRTAPAKKAENPKLLPCMPRQISIAAPHTRRPTSMAMIREMYTERFFLGRMLCSIPDTAPYAASSKAMHTAVGNMGGMPRVRERSRGAIKPTASPHGHPQIKPHNNTGMCIGQSMAPICGIWWTSTPATATQSEEGIP